MNRKTLISTVAVAGFVVVIAGCGGGDADQQRPAHASSSQHRSSPNLQGRVVFRRFFDTGHTRGALFVMDARTAAIRQITHPPPQTVDSLNGPPTAGSDGSALVFDRSTSDSAGLVSVALAGGNETKIKTPDGVPGDGSPALSPDGTKVAVARAWGDEDQYHNLKTGLWIVPVNGGRARLVADFGYTADVGSATWSRDGREIVFSAHNNGPGQPDAASALFSVRPDGGARHRLTPWTADKQVRSPMLSPDGTTVLFRMTPLDQDFGGDYYTVSSQGGTPKQLTHFGNGHTTGSAAWSPDGKMIVFADSGVGGEADLFVMNSDGSAIHRLTRTKQWESAPLWLDS